MSSWRPHDEQFPCCFLLFHWWVAVYKANMQALILLWIATAIEKQLKEFAIESIDSNISKLPCLIVLWKVRHCICSRKEKQFKLSGSSGSQEKARTTPSVSTHWMETQSQCTSNRDTPFRMIWLWTVVCSMGRSRASCSLFTMTRVRSLTSTALGLPLWRTLPRRGVIGWRNILEEHLMHLPMLENTCMMCKQCSACLKLNNHLCTARFCVMFVWS